MFFTLQCWSSECTVTAGRLCFLTTGPATELKHMDPNLALQQLPTVFITKTAQLQGKKANPKLITATEPMKGRKEDVIW